MVFKLTVYSFDMAFIYVLACLTATTLLANAQMDCSKAPSASLRTVCEQINNWDAKARAAPAPNKNGIVLPPGIDPKDIGTDK
jgi:hypothetical protein